MSESAAANSEEIPCPFCGERIKKVAIKCRFCGEFLKPSPDSPGIAAPASAGFPAGRKPEPETLYKGPMSRIMLVPAGFVLVFGLAISLGLLIGGANVESPVAVSSMRWIALIILILTTLRFAIHWLRWKTSVYRITSDRIEYETGLIAKNIQNLDLWRIEDLTLEQSTLQRLFGVGFILIVSSDKSTPRMAIGPLHDPRSLFDKLKRYQLSADQRQRVIHVEQ